MSSRTRTLHAALAALVTACAAAHQPSVPIAGSTRDMAALAGQWEGSYSSAATGRSGSISFTLSTGTDSAFGDVIMIPRGWGRPLQAWNGQLMTGRRTASSRVIVAPPERMTTTPAPRSSLRARMRSR